VILDLQMRVKTPIVGCAILFRALRTAAGDGMRKKDTEIPPERAFIYCRLNSPLRPIGIHIQGVFVN
jgi:hypothetical protein